MRIPALAGTADRPTGGGRDRVALSLAVLRLIVLPVFLAEHLHEETRLEWEGFDLVFALAAFYAIGALIVAIRSRGTVTLWPFAIFDLMFLTLLTYQAGGADADARYTLPILPLVAAFVARPRHTGLLAVWCLVAYVGLSILHPGFDGDSTWRLGSHTVELAWQCALAVAMSIILTRRRDRIAELAASRGVLVTQGLAAEQAARRDLAYALHDDVIQNLLSARQDLKSARRGRMEYLDRAETAVEESVASLRSAIFDLHPHQLESVGLRAALRAVGDRAAARGGFELQVDVDEDAAGPHDQLILALARELLQNTVKHASAHTVGISLHAVDGGVELAVADDGVGISPVDRPESLAQGHLGLASCAERVEAVGGTFEVTRRPEGGTLARAVLPLPAAAEADEEELESVPGRLPRLRRRRRWRASAA